MDEDTEPTPQEALELASKFELKGIEPRQVNYLVFAYFSVVTTSFYVLFIAGNPAPHNVDFLLRILWVIALLGGVFYAKNQLGYAPRFKPLPRTLKIIRYASSFVMLSIQLVIWDLTDDRTFHTSLVLVGIFYFLQFFVLLFINAKVEALAYGIWLRQQKKA